MKTDYRRLDRKARILLMRLIDDGAVKLSAFTADDNDFLIELYAIPKPGGGKPDRRSPGSGRKKVAAAKTVVDGDV